MQNEVMNYDHPDFMEFFIGYADTTKNCHHDHRGLKAFLILNYPKVNVEKTVAFMQSKGGHCDCEIMMNVPYHPTCPFE